MLCRWERQMLIPVWGTQVRAQGLETPCILACLPPALMQPWAPRPGYGEPQAQIADYIQV